jgi:hypothetical protein
VALAQGCSPQEDASMLHAVHYPRDLIADRVRFTPFASSYSMSSI